MRLKCLHSRGQSVLQLADTATLDVLLHSIETETGIPIQQVRIKMGFPPRDVPLEDPTALIGTMGFHNGETLRVEEGPLATPPVDLTGSLPPPLSIVPDSLEATMFREGGKMVKRVIAADNSCLFNAIQYICEGNHSRDGASHLRRLIARAVTSDPAKFNSAVLEKPPEEYARWVVKPESWGGAIELAILSEHFQTQIRCLDVQTARTHTFGETASFPRCVYTIYDGIHYDAVAFQVCEAAPEDMDITVFSPADDSVLQGCLLLVADLQRQRQFTDVGSFTLRCLVCQVGLKGQAEAQDHAKATGHANFSEY